MIAPRDRHVSRGDHRHTNTVDVYWRALDAGAAASDRYAGMLSREERARADCFRSAQDQQRYVVRHGVLRQLLGGYLACAPEDIRLSCNKFGKPSVESGDLRFNMAHSRDLALYAIARGLEIGCDLEYRDPRLASPAVAEHFFSPLERRMLRSLPRSSWEEGFFNCWTRKEAFVKARGEGLSFPLGKFDVSLVPDEAPALLRGGDGWSIRSFEPAPGFCAAIVAEGTSWELRLMGAASA